jgi:hypothetical protein
MSDIPLHLQRKFEQRWAARFTPPVAAAPKSTSLKGSPVRQKQKKDRVRDTSPQRSKGSCA